jgi:hypothetical protein
MFPWDFFFGFESEVRSDGSPRGDPTVPVPATPAVQGHPEMPPKRPLARINEGADTGVFVDHDC